MNKIISLIIGVLVVSGCNQSAGVRKSDPLESGRGFIEESLKGDYDEAQKYILQDSTNIQYFNLAKDFNSKRSNDEKEGYRDANILIDSTQKLSDSVTIISYSNTYKKKPLKLKMVKKNNEWFVDFKYSFTDSL
jgi:hypothetical protein